MNTFKLLMAIVLAISGSALAPGRSIAGNVPALWTEPDPIPKWITIDETSRISAAVFYQVNNDTVARFSKIADESVFNAIDYVIEVVAGAKLGEFTVQLEMKNSDLLRHRCPETVFCWIQSDGLTAFSIPDMPLDLETRLTYFDGQIETSGASALIKVRPTITTVGVDVARHFLEYAVAKVIRITAGSECLGSLQGEKIKLVWVFYSELLPVAELLARGEVSSAVSLATPMVGRIWSKIVPSIIGLSEEAANCVAEHLNPYGLFSRGAAFFAQVDFAAMVASAGTGVGASLPIVAAGDEEALEVEIGFAKRTSESSPVVDATAPPSSVASEVPVGRCDLTGLTNYHWTLATSSPPPISSRSFKGCDFRGVKLVNVDFRSTDLADVNFAGANLERSVFWGANLAGANFKGAALRSTEFNGANLAGADFSGTYMLATQFDSTYWGVNKPWSVTTTSESGFTTFYAYLDRADFSSATFEGVMFREAVLTNVNFSNLKTEPGAAWRDNWYDGASFVNANLSGLVEIDGGSFAGTDFTGADARALRCGINLSGAILTNTLLQSCNQP